MSDRKHWPQQQDQNIKTFNIDKKIPNSLKISEMMKQESDINEHNGWLNKQKSQNHLDQGFEKKQWTPQEDQLVYKLHNQFGNKWAIIAEHLKGRTDNCIKNHFYSRLRKGLRRINKIIEDQYKRSFKQFKIIDLYKVIQASDQKFKQVKAYPNQMTDFGHDLKNRLFIYAEEQSDGTEQYKVKVQKLLEDMNDFTKNYKRKSKKSRRYSPMGVDSVYRANLKKNVQHTQTGEPQPQKNSQQNQQKQIQLAKVEIHCPTVKIEQQTQKAQPKIKQKRDNAKTLQMDKQSLSVLKKQGLVQNAEQTTKKNRTRSKDYRHFSDDEDQEKNDVQYLRQQRLNHFAENILKTFKSYYSFQSFKSNSVMDEPFFQ